MALNALSSSQSLKDPQLPPCNYPAYKPNVVLPDSEYDVMHHEFLQAAQGTQLPLGPPDALVVSEIVV
ncbi:hypothetical protein DSO57_1025623 [Entomophthora muscae]|uniref:Uncharacterized protein n=1 Tax=Entomophthora muscae TaxID=34485 RepID=A0ACC2UBS3_9FUNG|nr:hypothetical protein DSO57_1025623 [Entomophthora muscae]